MPRQPFSDYPGLEKAMAYLRRELEPKNLSPGQRLPTVRSLARAAGVSTLALSEALRRLEAGGLVKRVPRRGTYFQRAPENPKPSHAKEKWEALSARIERDILAGHFRPGTALPQRRELQDHYGVSYPTLRKALDALGHDGVLFAHKRGHRVAPARKVAGKAALICIGLGDETGRLLIQNPRFQEFVFALQNAAALNQIRLLLLGHPPRQGLAALFGRIQALRDQHSCIGFVLWNTHLPLAAFLKTMAHVKAFRQPVAIMDEMNNLDARQPLLLDGAIRSFTLAGMAAGRQIARYLLGLGHKEVAYLSCYHGEGWSQSRHRGMEEVFRAAGQGGKVHLFSLDAADALWEARDAPPALRGMHAHFRDFIGEVRSAAKNFPAAHQLVYLQQSHEKLLRDLRMAMRLRPLLEDLAGRKGISACIAANDDMALVAMEYLQRHGRSIPGDLSIVGFDDSLRSAHFGITSYNFNFPAMAQRILAFMRNPGLREFEGKTILECDGLIMERESTGYHGSYPG